MLNRLTPNEALLQAAKSNDHDGARRLLDIPAHNAEEKAKKGKEEAGDGYFQAQAEVNYTDGQDGKTALHYAVEAGSLPITSLLMDKNMESRQVYVVNSPLGKLALHIQDSQVVKLDVHAEAALTNSKTGGKIADEIAAYFENAKHRPDIAINMHGTAFQQRVWSALCNIPAGKTVTYGELAKMLKTSARAIGQACKKNPIPIIVPCHRVVGANHQGGYMGKTEGKHADIKSWLLSHEKQV
jgi:methylated-DNA-[protein]-cysteine S-methyltransferase